MGMVRNRLRAFSTKYYVYLNLFTVTVAVVVGLLCGVGMFIGLMMLAVKIATVGSLWWLVGWIPLFALYAGTMVVIAAAIENWWFSR